MEDNITKIDEETMQHIKKPHCCKITMPCAKFVMASVFSLAGLAIGAALIFKYPNDVTLMPVGLSLVTSNIAVWIKMPKYNEQ